MTRTPLALLLLSFTAFAQTKPAPVADTSTHLPVTHVSLYKNGVGFFEHTGHISGNAAVTIDFTSAQLNDVLQTLTALDLNGGRIAGAGYNSTAPLEQQLKNLPLALSDDPTAADFYAAIRGARVEVHSGVVLIIGRLLSVETRSSQASADSGAADGAAKPAIARQYITVVSDAGEVRTVELTSATSVRLLDTALHTDVTRYLQLLDANRSQSLRHLTVEDRGTGTRELRLSYLSEVPIWKSTYRILFTSAGAPSSAQTATLQGWSVVDNTTGTDWNNVQLSLIAGAPQSFIQPLSQPIYSRRPEIPIAQEAQMEPQTFDSGLNGSLGNTLSGVVSDQSGAVISNAEIVATNRQTGSHITGHTNADGSFSLPGTSSGQFSLSVASPGFQTLRLNAASAGAPLTLTLNVGNVSEAVEVSADAVAAMPLMAAKTMRGYGRGRGATMAPAPPPPPPGVSYEDASVASFAGLATTNGFDDFFSYNLTEPVTIRKNESALVPILQAKVAAEPVTIVSFDGSATKQPLRALWITNSSGLTLDRGSFTIVEDGAFGGEGLLDPVHTGEKRLLSYAADQAVHVATDENRFSNKLTSISAAKGVLVLRRGETHDLSFTVHNSAASHRTVVMELPVAGGYKVDSSPKPVETTATVYRFRLDVDAGQTATLRVSGKRDSTSQYVLTNSDDTQLSYILNETSHDAKLEAALQPIFEARRRVADAENAVNQTNARVTALRADEDRQRANITALANADKGSRDRFVRDLNATEDAIAAAQKELAARTAALEAARAELANRIQTLQLEEPLIG